MKEPIMINRNKKDNVVEFFFDNGVSVNIFDYEVWEYYREYDDEYMSGGFEVDNNVVVDYDGVSELPEEVQFALIKCGFTLDL